MNKPNPGEIYRHYKGNVYQVLGVGLHTETLEELVVYKAVEGNQIWVRPLSMWQESVQTAEGSILRFRLLKS